MSVLEGEAGKFVCQSCLDPIVACPYRAPHDSPDDPQPCYGWVHALTGSHRGDPDGVPHSALPVTA